MTGLFAFNFNSCGENPFGTKLLKKIMHILILICQYITDSGSINVTHDIIPNKQRMLLRVPCYIVIRS